MSEFGLLVNKCQIAFGGEQSTNFDFIMNKCQNVLNKCQVLFRDGKYQNVTFSGEKCKNVVNLVLKDVTM